MSKSGGIDATVSTAVIAKLFNMTPRHLARLASDGIVPKAARGRYELVATVQAYVKHLQDAAAGKGNATQQEANRQVAEERAAKLRREREMAERLVVPTEAVGAEVEEMLARVRQRLVAVAGNVAAVVTGENNPNVVQDLIMEEIQQVLDELNYDASPAVARPPNRGAARKTAASRSNGAKAA